MGFWFVLFLFVVMTVAGELLRPKPKFDTPQPSSLGDFQVPTAEEGRAIPVVFGTCHIKGPNVVWYGDLVVSAITEKVKTGWFSSKTITKGYKYRLGMQLALCHGQIDEFKEIRFDNEKPAYTSTPVGDKLQLTLNDEGLFGGEDSEGGVSGTVDFYYGTATQTANDHLESATGATLPGYRNVSYAVFRQIYLGTSQYIKTTSFILRRCPQGPAYTGNENINGDANPACMLYEILTNKRWGLGLSSGQIDAASFTNSENTLFNEGLGLSMQLDSDTEAINILNDILRHIDGVMYTDPSTGLITLKLAREDYDPDTLQIFNASNLASCEYSRGSWTETKNVVKINYVDRDNDYQTTVAQQQNLANIQGRGGEVVAESFDFKGLSNATAANAVAARVLKTISYPLGKIHCISNRHAWALRPGSVFKLTWAPLGISNMIYRVIRISYGNLQEGRIEIDAVEDIFAIADTAFTAPAGSLWINPTLAPAANTAEQLVEAPYHFVGEDRWAMAYAMRANSQCLGYQVWTDRAEGTAYTKTEDIPVFTPTGTLQNAYNKDTAALDNTGFVVIAGRDMDMLVSLTTDTEMHMGKNFLQINNEIMAWRTVTNNGNGTYTISGVLRGVLDTVPADHGSGTRVWFFMPSFSGLTDTVNYPAELSLTAKLVSYTNKATLSIAGVTQLSLATASRAWKPYPPGNVKVNGIFWPQTTTGDASLTWAHRHRVTQTIDQWLPRQDDTYIASNEGNYTVEVHVGGVLKQTFSSLTGTSQAYTAAQRTSDDSDGSKTTRMRIKPVNGSYTGTQRDIEFIMTGLGMTLGQYMGGQQA